VNVPVSCACGWTGWRPVGKITKRPCPWCDGKVKRWRALGQAMLDLERAKQPEPAPEPTPLESYIALTKEPLPPAPRELRMVETRSGKVHYFRIPAHLQRLVALKGRKRGMRRR
jgi:hypothetical protein